MTRAALILVTALAAATLAAAPALAQYNGVPRSGMMTKGDMPAGIAPAELQKVDFEQKLGAQVPLDLPFRDESGKPVQLRQFFDGRPVILTLVYFECPMLCTEVLNSLVRALKVLSLEPGRDFNIVTVSFNAAEKPVLAADKKRTYLERYGRPGAEHSWHFLTGEPASIKLLTETVGFHYVFDERLNQFAHPAGILVTTPEGVVSKYLYGIDYAPRDVRLALVEASDRKVGSPVDRVLLYCYHYDPTTGKYGLAVLTLIRAGGVLTLAALGAFIFVTWRRGARQPAQPGGPAAIR
jgi:protein SCO1/2